MHSLKSALRLLPLCPRSRATIHTLNLQAPGPPPAPAPGQRRDTPDRLCRWPWPALLPCLCPFLFSPRRREGLFFLRLDPLASLSILVHGKPVLACGSFLSITSGVFLLFVQHKQRAPHPTCHATQKVKLLLDPTFRRAGKGSRISCMSLHVACTQSAPTAELHLLF